MMADSADAGRSARNRLAHDEVISCKLMKVADFLAGEAELLGVKSRSSRESASFTWQIF
jgi:hypothetical protein